MSTVIESDWENNRLKEECEALRQQLAERDAEIAKLRSDYLSADSQAFDSWQQLAAAQLQNTQLREALHYSLGAWHYDGVSDEHGSIFQEANNRCDQPTDTSALEAMIAKAGECMRERALVPCKELSECEDNSTKYRAAADFCGLAIRALPGVTLEDLK